jgi:predicted secreted hydrolase
MGKVQKLFVTVLLGLLLIGSSAFGGFAAAEDVALADDAYHYRYWADGRHDNNYIEWWYFNLFDAEQDLQAIFTYLVADPENRSGRGLAQIAAVAYTTQGIVSEIDLYPPNLFSASYAQADVQIEAHTIQVMDADTYRLVGATRNHRLAWDLTYVRQARPWFAIDRMRVGLLRWEQMGWLIYMPRAEVSGQVVVDGQVYAINAPGYHDHNWGEWIFSNALWNWAQYSEPGLAFEMGDFIDKPVGAASIEFQGERTVFTKDQYQLTHTQWAFDAENRRRYPIETTLVAENDTRRLVLTLRAIKTDPLRGDLPFPLPDAIIYEQTARYEGQLLERNTTGEWVLSASISGHGFKEYTARRY